MTKVMYQEPKVTIHTNADIYDISHALESITINYDVTQPVPSMQIRVNAVSKRTDTILQHSTVDLAYMRDIPLNSVIVASIDGTEHDFLGFIDNIAKDENRSARGAQITYSITCSLLVSKMLMRDEIINAPALATIVEGTDIAERSQFFKFMRGQITTRDGTKQVFMGEPQAAVKYILNNAIATNAKVKIKGKELSVKSFIGRSNETDAAGRKLVDLTYLNNEYIYDPALTQYAGNIFQYIRQCIDPDFYEYFFTTTTDENDMPRNRIVIRPKPYTHRAMDDNTFLNWPHWEDLDAQAVYDNEIISKNIGIADYEVKNSFHTHFTQSLMVSASGVIGRFGYQFPIVNLDSIKQFGLRHLAATSKMLNLKTPYEDLNVKTKEGEYPKLHDAFAKTDVIDQMLDKRNKLAMWHSFPRFLSGRITLPFRRIEHGSIIALAGERYYDFDTKQAYFPQFYVKGVMYFWRVGHPAVTQLNLTRGAHPSAVKNWYDQQTFTKIDSMETSSEDAYIVPKEDMEKIKEQYEARKDIPQL